MDCKFIPGNVTLKILGSHACFKFSQIMPRYFLFLGIKFTHDFPTCYSHVKVWESFIPMGIRGNHS